MTAPATPVDLVRLRDLRARRPSLVAETLSTRVRRPLLRGDGRLLIVAADHPARGALGVGNDPMAMADRTELLERMAVAASHPGVDGVLGTADIIDDLALLGLLDDKIVVGSMNRGGLHRAAFEMDDRRTAYDVPAMVSAGVDFAKTLVRINLADHATAATLEATARAVTECAAAGLPIMLEPFMSEWRDGRIVHDLSADAVVLSVAIASGLGASSAYTWLKLPVVDQMERVVEASTMPVLLLGGDANVGADATLQRWSDALALPGVRGLTAGRTLLYPRDGDVAAAVDAAARLVHPELDPAR